MTAPLPEEKVAALAEAEFAHGGYKSAGVGQGWRCWCDADLREWWPKGGVTPRDTALDYALRAHRTKALAPLVAGWLAEAEAAALREAADYLERHETHAIETALGGVAYPVAVLRDIAATESEPR